MKFVIRLLSASTIYFCVATVLAIVVGAGMLWFKGYLTEDRAYDALAALNGIDEQRIREQQHLESSAKTQEQPSHSSAMDSAMEKSLDLDMREMAIEKGLLDLTNLQSSLQIEHSRFLEIRDTYNKKLEQITNESRDSALKDLQAKFENMEPQQAKEQMVRMFQEGAENDIVEMLRDMSTSKAKKIIAEFKNDQDAQQLYEILTRIRLGEPTVSTINEAKSALRDINPSSNTTDQ